METMQNYTTYCTGGQTKVANELGAPIEKIKTTNYAAASYNGYIILTDTSEFVDDTAIFTMIKIPTTQQMLSWLQENGFLFKIEENPDDMTMIEVRKKLDNSSYRVIASFSHTKKSAKLMAIDVALDCLKKGNIK